MGFWSKLFARGAQNMSSAELDRDLSRGFFQSGADSGLSPLTAMQHATVYSCVRVLAESVSQVPLPIYLRNSDGGKTWADRHTLFPLLNSSPNEWQSAFEFRENMMGQLCLRGKSFAYINRLADGRVFELLPIHPDAVTVEQLPSTRLQFYVNSSDAKVPKLLNQDQMLYVRGMTPDGVNPLTPIGVMRKAVGLATTIEDHGRSMFGNGAWFRGYLEHPGKLGPDAQKNLRESFDAQHSGNNKFKTPILEEGMKWQQAGMTGVDAQFLENRKFQRSEIASIFRVPPHMIGDLERATFSNIEQQSIEFVQYSLTPWFKRIEQAMMRDLLSIDEMRYTIIEHLADGLLRGDRAGRYTAYGQAIKDGWMNRNEVRGKENLNAVPGLDAFLSPLNMTTGNPPDPAKAA